MSSRFTCRFCKEQFDAPKGLYKHLQTAHTAGTSRDNRTCPICGVLCSKYEGYRDHLLYIHGQTDEGQKLTFKSLNDFLVWKAELELKHNCKYVLQTSPKVLSSKEKKYFYQCDRSDPKAKDKKITSVVMKTCSSVISVVESSGVFKVEYWDAHSNHCESPSAQSFQNEIEAAISSVEMVNAISESDDSYDRSEDMMPDNSSIEKQSLMVKTNLPSSVNNFNSPPATSIKNARTIQTSVQFDASKRKSANSSVLLSLASVACGKGIVKKSSEMLRAALKPEVEVNSKNAPGKPNENFPSASEIQEIDLTMDTAEISPVQVTELKDAPSMATVVASTAIASPKVLATGKTPSGLTAIAPKITNITTNNVNSLFTSNSAFSNQLVIVNPIGMNQNQLSANQNVFTAGQNILLSLGNLGQNVVPTSTTPQTIASAPIVGDKVSTLSSDVKTTNAETSMKVSLPSTSTTSKSSTTQSASNSISNVVTSTATSVAPVSLTTGINPAPVILSSLPVGSTFMSVNNNLIPIATPSGAFLPSSLPPNIVLTPVPSTSAQSKDTSIKTIPSMPPNIVLTPVPSTSSQQTDSTFKGIPNLPPNIVLTPVPSTTGSNVSTASVQPTNVQTQARLSASSTVAITVSSIVKQPVYSSSSMKNMGNVVTCTSVVSSTALNSFSKNKSLKKIASKTVSGRVSPFGDIPKFKTSTPVKTYSKMNKYTASSIALNCSKILPAITGKLGSNVSLIPINTSVSTTSSARTKSGPSARKRIAKTGTSVLKNSSVAGTKVVNSNLSSAPISSIPNVTIKPQQLDTHKPGTLLFESSGDVYMLEPVENDAVENTTSMRKVAPQSNPVKIKIERSVQTDESLSASIVRRKRPPPADDSAVMLKVKCYQMEMKYLSIQAECKRLKVELTRERLKNAELTGEKSLNVEDDSDSTCKVSGIMKEIEDEFSGNKFENIYTMTKTSVLQNLYGDLEDLCSENIELYKELENYRAHDKFYKSLKKKLYDEEFEA